MKALPVRVLVALGVLAVGAREGVAVVAVAMAALAMSVVVMASEVEEVMELEVPEALIIGVEITAGMALPNLKQVWKFKF